VSSDQLIVLVLLAAAFAAGWFARGGRAEGQGAGEHRRKLKPPRAKPPEPAAPPPPGPDPVVAEADDALRRALSAVRAARAVAMAPAGASPAATRSVLRVLDQRLGELESCADRLEIARGEGDAAFAAFDDVVSTIAAARRRIDGDADLDGIEDARAAWERATRDA
jgi:hypothetical protein